MYISHYLPRYLFSNISTGFIGGRGRLTDIKKNQSLSLELAMEWNGAAGPQWACGCFCHIGSMPGWHDAHCVSSQLGGMEGGINEEEEKKTGI